MSTSGSIENLLDSVEGQKKTHLLIAICMFHRINQFAHPIQRSFKLFKWDYKLNSDKIIEIFFVSVIQSMDMLLISLN